jgi:cytochrome c-type biogenesis protein CcmE
MVPAWRIRSGLPRKKSDYICYNSMTEKAEIPKSGNLSVAQHNKRTGSVIRTFGFEINMQPETTPAPTPRIKIKFIIGSLMIAAAIIYLVVSSTQANAQYFLTVDEVKARGQTLAGKSIRLSGVVLGDTIYYDPQTLELSFTIAHIPGDNQEVEKEGGLAAVLHAAAADPARQKISVHYKGARPDLLKNEAQAILSGTLNSDGSFNAREVLLKCPTKYEDAVPGQAGKQ